MGQKISEPIKKIGDIGIGSDYNFGQVYCSKFWKIGKANLSDVSNVRVILGFNVGDFTFPSITHWF